MPDFGLLVSWQPRQTTGLSLSIYQNQNFSISSSQQFQVNRGFIASVSQRLFSKVAVRLSGGWQQTENLALSSDEANGASTEYVFLSGGIRWDLNDWLYWQTTLWATSGNRTSGSSDSNQPEGIASTGLNLLF